MRSVRRQRLRLSCGAELSFVTAGDDAQPAVLLLHGFPSSAQMFRQLLPELGRVSYVVAPDLPGFGESDVLPGPSFSSFADAIGELLERLALGPRYIYLHDFGAPVGFQLAMHAPELVLGLVIQNANAHDSGLGPAWAQTRAYWARPTRENEAAATAHLSRQGTRDQYVAAVPDEIAARISPRRWEEDWRVMSLPGRLATQRALIADYQSHVARFPVIADYLRRFQPPALLLWGRHDAFFSLAELLSWLEALPRMEAHVFDAGHLLLETHSAQAAALMADFVRRTRR